MVNEYDALFEGDWCQTCRHTEARHNGGMKCIECSCKEMVYEDEGDDEEFCSVCFAGMTSGEHLATKHGEKDR